MPGPTVLVSTVNTAGNPNLAPKSWLQMASFEPPILMFSGTRRNTTEENILATGCFAVNSVDSSLVARTVESVERFGRERIEKSGFTLTPAKAKEALLIVECKAHLECRLYDRHEEGRLRFRRLRRNRRHLDMG
ncbi:MAG: flavin reductase family protein [bacterium]|nr:flavin reductase family protein [bacterium]